MTREEAVTLAVRRWTVGWDNRTFAFMAEILDHRVVRYDGLAWLWLKTVRREFESIMREQEYNDFLAWFDGAMFYYDEGAYRRTLARWGRA